MQTMTKRELKSALAAAMAFAKVGHENPGSANDRELFLRIWRACDIALEEPSVDDLDRLTCEFGNNARFVEQIPEVPATTLSA